jgi:FKBP-type peptidyl-prolyl cis-trans isomerase FkpA
VPHGLHHPISANPMLQSLRSAARRIETVARAAVLIPLLGAASFMSACGTDSTAPNIPSNPAVETFASALGVNIAAMTRRSDNLFIQDLVVGTGTEAVSQRTVRVTYSGFLINGNRFDSNVGGSPFSFVLGAGQVIAGWDQGVVGMRVGGKRRLVIGSTLGYGPRGQGPIPANSTLVFDVEVLGVQ